MAQELQYHFASRDLRSPTSCIALGGSSIIRSFRFFSSSSRLPTDRTRAIRYAYMYICVFGLLISAIHFPSASNRILAGVRFRDEVRLRVRHAIRVFPDSASRDIRRFIGLLQILLSRLKRVIWIFRQEDYDLILLLHLLFSLLYISFTPVQTVETVETHSGETSENFGRFEIFCTTSSYLRSDFLRRAQVFLLARHLFSQKTSSMNRILETMTE